MHAPKPIGTANDEAFVVNVWHVSDGHQDEFVEMIDGLFEYLRTLDGFIEGAVLHGSNPTLFVSYARMRSAQDRQRVFDDERVSGWLRKAGEIARADLHSYHVLNAYVPAAPSDAAGGATTSRS